LAKNGEKEAAGSRRDQSEPAKFKRDPLWYLVTVVDADQEAEEAQVDD